MLSKMKIIFICKTERLKMRYVSKGLALACLVAVVPNGLGFALPTARAQEQSPAEVVPVDDADPAPSPDTDTHDADTD